MAREQTMIPFGATPAKPDRKGTVIYYDDFQDISDEQLSVALNYVRERKFKKLILYPLHEETVRRMDSNKRVDRFYKREQRLQDWIQQVPDTYDLGIELWEEKRKKYTPMEAAFRHITTKYAAPHFIYMSPYYSQLFASYPSFEEWITKVRLIVSEPMSSVPAKLQKYEKRWDTI